MSKKSKVISGFRPVKDISWQEREDIVKEYLSSNCSKRAIWKRYTGQEKEHGRLLKWIRILGYDKSISSKQPMPILTSELSERRQSDCFEHLQLKRRIEELEARA